MSPNTPRHSAASATENGRARKNASGSMGWALRASQTTKLARVTTLTDPTATTTPEVHPRLGASMIAHRRSPRPATDRPAPTGSGRVAAGFLESGTRTRAPTNPKTAIGTLTRKIDPHQNLESSRPPAMGPMAMPSPMVPAQVPMARARSWGSRKMSLMIDSDAGMVKAAPTPMIPRHAMSGCTEPDRAAPIDPAANRVSPKRKNLLRPNRSARLPPTSSRPAKTMAYASTIHCSWLELACRSRTRVGRATLRMVLSTFTISAARHTTTNAAQRWP